MDPRTDGAPALQVPRLRDCLLFAYRNPRGGRIPNLAILPGLKIRDETLGLGTAFGGGSVTFRPWQESHHTHRNEPQRRQSLKYAGRGIHGKKLKKLSHVTILSLERQPIAHPYGGLTASKISACSKPSHVYSRRSQFRCRCIRRSVDFACVRGC